MDIKAEIKHHQESLIELRRDFHRHPELGFREFRTSKIIGDYLTKCGISITENVAHTGIVGLLQGDHPGKTVLLRADMDGLPVHEETGLPFQSEQEGLMHACGHDAHVAMLLVAAKILSQRKDQIHGAIKFVFQPNEEEAGAALMVQEGVLESPKVDACFGIHISPLAPTGFIAATTGAMMASSHYFKLKIIGKSCHGGAPEDGIDPILCAAQIIQDVQMIQTRTVSALDATTITFGKIHGGNFNITIPDQVELEGSVRCLHSQQDLIMEKFEDTVRHVCHLHQAEYGLSFQHGNSLLSNDPVLTELLVGTAKAVVPPAQVISNEMKAMGGDDFAEFIQDIPGVYYIVGAGDGSESTGYGHHHSKFDIDENAMPVGVEMHVMIALAYLDQYKG